MSAATQTRQRQRGLTLIELLVAMVLGLMVTAGIITVFVSTSASNKAQDQMATLQEAGRYAMSRLRSDIGMANAQFCSASGGNIWKRTSAGGNPQPALDDLRTPTFFANPANDDILDALHDVTTPWGNPYHGTPTTAFAMPAYLSMRGSDCTTATCTPVSDGGIAATGIPEQGTAVGKRVVGTSVLTLRYLDPSMGWSIGHAGGSFVTDNGEGAIASISLIPVGDEPPVTDFGAGHLAMLSDCSYSEVFAVAGQGTAALVPQGTPTNFELPGAIGGLGTDARLFDFNNAFKTVTYYLKVVDAGDGRTTGALIRRVNGDNQELVRGIERLNFRYGVLLGDGTTHFLTAAQVDASTDCPFQAPTAAINPANRTGCLWRAVQSIEVNLLANGQTPLYSLTPGELSYTYASDGITTPKVPADHSIKPETDQGFVPALLRREFTALIAVRNYNP